MIVWGPLAFSSLLYKMILLIILLAEFLNNSGQTGSSAFMHYEEEKLGLKQPELKRLV